MQGPSDSERALALVQGVELPHPDGELLTCFVRNSIDQDRAARHLLRACEQGGSGLDAFLARWKSLVQLFSESRPCSASYDEQVVRNIWARDGVCHLTGKRGSWLDPLTVTPILPSMNTSLNIPHQDTFAAYLDPSHVEWLRSRPLDAEPHSNLWLVRKSAADAFARGFFEVRVESYGTFVSSTLVGLPQHPWIVRQASDTRQIDPRTESTATVASPDATGLEIMSRFAEPIRWLHVAKSIHQVTSPSRNTAPMEIPGFTTRLLHLRTACCDHLLAFWLALPPFVRTRTYRILAFLGSRIYGPSSSLKVQRLPFGMYLKISPKLWHPSLANEYGALDILRRQTNLPVAKPLDLVSDSEESYLITSRLPGRPLGFCIDLLSDEQLQSLAFQLKRHLKAIRGLQRDPVSSGRITNAVGEACYDARINAAVDYDAARGDFIGLFQTEHEFNKILRSPHAPDTAHQPNHRIVFTHGDLNMRNILVNGKTGTLTGIVDWEMAGWYPDYWEYTKAYYTTKLKWRWLKAVVEPTFCDLGDFSEDLDIERKLWWYCW